MLQRRLSLVSLAAMCSITFLCGCAQTPPAASAALVPSNPPPVQPGPGSGWYHVEFTSNSHTIDKNGQLVVADITNFMQLNPGSVATIAGRTDMVGSANYNMHLSHIRADAVRDALVYHSNIAADRVETRWTGETRQSVATGNDTVSEENRVVDIALH